MSLKLPFYLGPRRGLTCAVRMAASGVVYLLTRRERFAKLKHMLHLFDSNYNDRFHYPLVIFHDDLRPEDQARIRKATNSQVEFHTVRPADETWEGQGQRDLSGLQGALRDDASSPSCWPHAACVGVVCRCRSRCRRG